MNKKNITLILVGFLILILQFNITVGNVTIDIFSDLAAFILIAVGGLPLADRNITFKKMRRMIFIGLILSILSLLISLNVLIPTDVADTKSIVTGLSTIAAIYITYYFSEGLILEAKFQEKSAVTRSLRITWFVLGALIFGSFIAVTSGISMVIILVQAITAIFAIFYCSSVLTACKPLYMEGLPTKHMNI